jgi:hypothetical protein
LLPGRANAAQARFSAYLASAVIRREVSPRCENTAKTIWNRFARKYPGLRHHVTLAISVDMLKRSPIGFAGGGYAQQRKGLIERILFVLARFHQRRLYASLDLNIDVVVVGGENRARI